MSDPSCREYRELLGVYVVGAIDPAERAWVDAHLAQCYECREELTALALLPALMHRIPVAEAEAIARSGPLGDDHGPPSDELLTSLLARVAARRRSRRVRSAFAIAAAVLIAAGGAAAAAQALAPSAQPARASFDVASARQHGVRVTVRYARKNGWGVAIWVRSSGLPTWTRCKFYVVTASGQRTLAGGWLVGPDGSQTWYPAQTSLPESSITAFVLVVHGSPPVRIPAA